VAEARQRMANYFRFYNRESRHQCLNRKMPDQFYEESIMCTVAA